MDSVDSSMRLPPGKTCEDCRHLSFCLGMGVTRPERTACDWAPSRFAEPTTEEADAIWASADRAWGRLKLTATPAAAPVSG